jgi:CRP/FNR family transcriptional regulator
VLRGLTAEEAEAVLKTTEDRTYANGASIFSAGDPQTGICLVKQGLVEEFRLTESGAKLPMSRTGTGKLLALASVRGRYCCFAEAVEESVVGVLSFQALEALCRKFPKLAVNLLEVLASRLGEVEDRLELLAFSGLRSRVAWALLGLYGIHGPRLEGVTHEALASWAASSRPKVSMVLEELQQAGLLKLSRGMIELRDPVGLEEWAKQLASA